MAAKDKVESMGTVTVTVSLSEYVEGNFEQIIIERVVGALEHKIEQHISEAVESRILKLADKEFKKLSSDKMEEFFIKAHRKTNHWGDPTGEAVSLREILVDRFQKYLDEKVNDKGEFSNYSDKYTRAQWMLNQLAHKPLTDAVNETVSKIAAKAKEQVQASVSRYIAEQLAPTISAPQLKQ